MQVEEYGVAERLAAVRWVPGGAAPVRADGRRHPPVNWLHCLTELSLVIADELRVIVIWLGRVREWIFTAFSTVAGQRICVPP